MRRRPLLRDHLLLLSAISALILFLCGPNELSAQTVNINTNWTRGQIRSAFTNATAGSTIKFAAGNYDVNRLRVGADNVTIEGSGNRETILDGKYGNGGFGSGEIILVRNRDNVTVKNLTLKGAKKGSYNGVVAGYNANGLRVEDCDIEVELTQGGVYLSEGGGQVITGNDIYNPRAIHFLEAADLIFVRNTNSNGWLIENNRLISRGSPDRDPTWAETLEFLHVDNIQTIDCNGGTVNANYIEINIDVERHFHGVLIENGSGTYTVTNNYMVNKFVDNGASGSDFEDEQLDFILGMYGSSSSKYLVYHNTIVGDGEQLLRYAQTNPDSEFKNNILYRRTRGRGPIAKIESGSSNGKWSHNLFYNHGPANGTVVDSINGWRNVSSFESLTGGSGSVFGDPNFVLEGPDVLAGSPVLNAGTPIAGVNADLDGNSRDATPTIGAIEVGGATVTESISLEGPLVIAADGTETFIIDYVAGQQRDIILDVFDSNWSWKGQTRFEDVNGSGSITGQVDYGMISTATGFVLARIIADGGNWETAVEEARLDVDITSTVPEFVAVSGPTNVPVAGSVTYTVDYNANSTRDIVIGIYDANWKWIRGKRFRNVSGSGTLSHTINYTTKPITTATANVKASMRPPGGNWRTEVATDYIRDIVVGDNTAPDVEYDLWDATPSANVSVHDSWGVTGLAPGRHLLLPNFDLDTGYSQFEFQYTTGFAGASSVEVRLGSPTGQLLGTADFGSTGSWNKSSAAWTTTGLTPVSGTHDVYIVVKSGYFNAFKCWFRN